MNKSVRHLLFAAGLVCMFAFFVACGDDSSSGPEGESSSSFASEVESSDSIDDESSSSIVESSSSKVDESSSSAGAKVSSSSREDSSSSVDDESSASLVVEVMSAGYYKKNCPAGHICKDAASTVYLNSKISYGEILDPRDDQVYKVTTIGAGDDLQIWMAQNLNYVPKNVSDLGIHAWSGCYEYSADSCAKYGRLYTWEVVMNDANCLYGSACKPSGDVQGICPVGWHLPSVEEWTVLERNAGGEDCAATALKSTSGWDSQTGEESERDVFGFSTLPGGLRYNYDGFGNASYNALFWTSSEEDDKTAHFIYMAHDYEEISFAKNEKNDAFSVRCLRDLN